MKLFRTSFEADVDVQHLSQPAFLAMVFAACKQLDWHIHYVSPSGIIAYTGTWGFQRRHEITMRYIDGTAVFKSTNADNALFDWGKNKRLVTDLIRVFTSKQSDMNEVSVNEQYQILKSDFDGSDYLARGAYEELNKNAGFLDLFIPRTGYMATPVLAMINIIVFVIMVSAGVHFITPNAEDIYNWGGNFGPATLNGQWWRILTCSFVHIGLMHLLMNLYGLIYAGSLLEPIIGAQRFVAAYLFTAITSSLLSLYWHPDIVSAGASGAIFGLFGVLLAMLTTNLLHKGSRKTLLPNMIIFVGVNLLYGMREGVDNAGHIGGLIGGFAIGYALYPSLKEGAHAKVKHITIGVLGLLVVTLTFVGFRFTTNSPVLQQEILSNYDRRMNKFAELESMALEVITTPEGYNQEQYVADLKDRGIYYWDECIKVLDSVKTMSIPSALLQRNDKILQYCALRKEMYQLLYRQATEKTGIYKFKIEELSMAADDIVNELKKENDSLSARR